MRLNTYLVKLLSHSILTNIVYMLYRYFKVVIGRKQRIVTADNMVMADRKSKLAVIGCGPSINELDDDFFEQLDDYDVTVFSYAALLPVHIKYYLYEIPRGTLQQHHEEFLYPDLQKKGIEGKIEHIMLKNPHAKEGMFYKLFPSVLSSMTFPIQLRSPNKLAVMLKIIDFFGLASKYFFQARASLFATCYWADALGYDEILLVGIDLNTSKYFYEKDSKWVSTDIPNPYPDDVLEKDIHPTNDEELGIRLEDAMSVLKESISAKIYVNNPQSALAKIFEHKSKP